MNNRGTEWKRFSENIVIFSDRLAGGPRPPGAGRPSRSMLVLLFHGFPLIIAQGRPEEKA
jgi:hypothetical protein